MNEFVVQAVDWVRREPGYALLTVLGSYLFLLCLILVLLVRLTLLGRRQARLLRGTDGMSVERMLLEQMDNAEAVRNRVEDAARIGNANSAAIRQCLRRVGLIRYDAFADVGGEQSFSVAVLDEDGNGLVISGLNSRHDMRVYAKPVVAGGSPLTLTDEERKAIAGAVVGGPVTLPGGRSRRQGTPEADKNDPHRTTRDGVGGQR